MTNTVILYCDSVRFLPPRAATKRAMAGGRREEVDLNKVSEFRLKAAKLEMDVGFAQTLKRPGDDGYE